MKKTKKAFSLILAMILVLIMSLIAFFLLEYMIPFSKNTKWIENTSKAYYQAEGAIEQALRFVNIDRVSYSSESGSIMSSNAIWNTFSMVASWTSLPENLNWNSEYDKNFDIIRSWDPIQLEVWNNSLSNLNITFKVPDLNSSWTETLSWSDIVNWQLNSETESLNAWVWNFITAANINSISNIALWWKTWIKLDWTNQIFSAFYTANCSVWHKCTLKLSVINKLELSTNNIPVPYLEWKITTSNSIPLRYTSIKSAWKSYGFKKELEVRIPQQTVNEAFDFSVFQ